MGTGHLLAKRERIGDRSPFGETSSMGTGNFLVACEAADRLHHAIGLEEFMRAIILQALKC